MTLIQPGPLRSTLYVMGDLSEKDDRKQHDAVQAQVNALPLAEQGRLIDLEQAADLVNNVQALWQGATLPKREIWFKLMFNRVLVYDGQDTHPVCDYLQPSCFSVFIRVANHARLVSVADL